MSSGPDYNALRALALDSGADEEAVTVNTRALIDKILARYSGEWTTLREMIQNAADASASRVTIRYETRPSPTVAAPRSTDPSAILKHVLLHHSLQRLVVSNDGHPFQPSDWSRLKRIAEGNPDETKIGTYGVGVYSVFADCEEPLIRSGDTALAFYWKGNSLFTKHVEIPSSQSQRLGQQSDTTFILDYRNTTTPLPGLVSLSRFLATSLTFVNLQTVDLWLDDWNLLTLTKKVAPGVTISIPKNIETKTAEGIMKVAAVQREMSQIDARWLKIVGWVPPQPTASWTSPSTGSSDSIRGFFSRLAGGPSDAKGTRNHSSRNTKAEEPQSEELTKPERATIFLRMTTAEVRATVSGSFAGELERATKKPPPKQTKVSVLTSLHEDPSPEPREASVDVFKTVLPKTSGKVFIGFPTAQTTGLLAHVSAPSVIPTVERESIDLNARHVRTWNMELLRATGILLRIAWACDMDSIKSKLSRLQSQNKSIGVAVATLLPEAIHIFRQFTFRESTPSSRIGELLEESFWMSDKLASIELFSSLGVYPNEKVRLPTSEVSDFVHELPIIPRQIVEGAGEFVQKLKTYGLVTDITVADVRDQLGKKTLDENQLQGFLVWCAQKKLQNTMSPDLLRSLTDIAIAWVGEKVVKIKDLKYFVNGSPVPGDLPHSPETASFNVTKSLSKEQLAALGWEELQIVPWLKYLVEQSGAEGALPAANDLTQSLVFSAQVLPVISKHWEGLSPSSKSTVLCLLMDRTVIPTRLGMRKPAESYFPSVKLFSDLAVIKGVTNVKDKFLTALGVRKTVALEIIFDRLLSWDEKSDGKAAAQPGKWNHVDLIRYLASIADDIPAADLVRLRLAAICTAEDAQHQTKPTTTRYRPGQLYEPRDDVRKLGFTLLHWPGVYKPGSAEGRFLTTLGLLAYPSSSDLIASMAKAPSTGEIELHHRLLTFFIANFDKHRYGALTHPTEISARYLPLEGRDFKELAAPVDCFVNEKSAVLGFPVLRKDLHPHASKFGVLANPSVAECISRLIKMPPRTQREASSKFGYLSTRIGDFSQTLYRTLGESSIVPVVARAAANASSGTRQTRLQRPSLCFIGDGSTFGDIFDFVDFGADANAFLFACGSKHAPSEMEVAALIAREPARVLGTLQSVEKYLRLLRSLANSFASLKKDRSLFQSLSKAPCLLASKDAPPELGPAGSERPGGVDDDLNEIDEDQGVVRDFLLATAGQVVIMDDFISYSLFKDKLLLAPQEEAIEDFYIALGSPLLSSLVVEEPRIGKIVTENAAAKKLQKIVYERSRLFLYDYPRDMIRHDSRWLEQNLQVQTVKSISLRRSLRNTDWSHSEARTAAITSSQKRWTLWITEDACDLFQVSQALVNLLLIRPKPHSTMTLEVLLESNLMKLRSRGYNVDRILRARAAEARIAEEQRRKNLEEEQESLQKGGDEKEELAVKGQEVAAKVGPSHQRQPSADNLVPAPLNVSPTAKERAPDSSQSRRAKGLFHSFSRRLGLGDNNSSNNSNNNAASPTTQGNGNSVPDPQALATALSSAIQASRPHNSATIFSLSDTSQVQDTSTYCDSRPGHDISFMGATSQGIRIFLANGLPTRGTFLISHFDGLNLFGGLLREVGDIFGLAHGNLHIFYEEHGRSVAFNRQGSMFFNYDVFSKKHLDRGQKWLLTSEPRVGEPRQQLSEHSSRGSALVYWFVVMCHELAHNIVLEHSSRHSYWTETFVTQYFSRAVAATSSNNPQQQPQKQLQQPNQQQQDRPTDDTPPPYSTG